MFQSLGFFRAHKENSPAVELKECVVVAKKNAINANILIKAFSRGFFFFWFSKEAKKKKILKINAQHHKYSQV